MIPERRITALFFAILVTLISVAYPVVPTAETIEIQNGTQALLLQESSSPNVFLFQENLNRLVVAGWKIATDDPGFLFIDDTSIRSHPAFRGLKKLIIFNPDAYKPCKCLFLFPFHDFL